MVGVPDFLIIWSIGPSCLIGPVIIFLENRLIKGPPIMKTTIKEVTTDKPVLKVRYLKTLRNEYWSIKEVNKLKSTYIPFIIFLLKSLSPVAFDPLIIR